MIYFAHPYTTYNTKIESELISIISDIDPDILNPNSPYHERKYKIHGMDYFISLVDYCDSLIIYPFEDGSIGAGIAKEANHAFDTGKDVYFINPNDFTIKPIYKLDNVLNVEETRSRIKNFKSFNESITYDFSKIGDYIDGTHTVTDGVITVDGNVELDYLDLTEIPFKYNSVSGYFQCYSNAITSLEGCPVEVGGYFSCYVNKLTSLKGCPSYVNGDFNCSNNNITSLEGCPKNIDYSFACESNKLTSLEDGPETVANLHCRGNKLISLKGCPDVSGNLDVRDNNIMDFYGIGKVGGIVMCKDNPVYQIFQMCPTYEFITYLNEFRPIRNIEGKVNHRTILGKRLQECLYMCDVTMYDVSKMEFKNYELLE